MNPYPKTNNLFVMDRDTKKRIYGMYTTPELEHLKNIDWVFTEKVDGTNIRLIYNEGDLEMRGRSDKAMLPGRLAIWFMDRKDELLTMFMERFPQVIQPVCIYGEGYGAGIQKGGAYREDQGFVAFDVKIGDVWQPYEEAADIVESLTLEFVPLLHIGPLHDGLKMVQNEETSMWGDFPAEGVMARPRVELQDRYGARIMTKIKARDFGPHE